MHPDFTLQAQVDKYGHYVPGFVYIASPYTHASSEVMQARFEAAEAYVAQQLRLGRHVYSPIVHCHALASKYTLPTDAEYWRAYNYAMLAKAMVLEILMLDGWQESVGVKGEQEYAVFCNIPVQYAA